MFNEMYYLLSTPVISQTMIPNSIGIKSCILLIIVFSIISVIIGYLIGLKKLFKNLPELLSLLLTSMDNYIIIFSLVLLVISFCFSTSEAENKMAVIILNVFASIIFSWLLTKKSSGKDFKEKEEELALRSYRHINYIESSANAASKTIEQYALNSSLDDKTKLVLSSAKEQIKYIQGGINTCKMDWLDLLSEDEKNKRSDSTCNPDHGTVQKVISDIEMNQEDA